MTEITDDRLIEICTTEFPDITLSEREQLMIAQKKAEKWDNCLDLGKKCTPEDYLAIGAKCLERELEKDKTIIPLRKENKELKEKLGITLADLHIANERVTNQSFELSQQTKILDEIKKGVKKMEDYQKAVTKETKDYPYIDIRNIVKELKEILEK